MSLFKGVKENLGTTTITGSFGTDVPLTVAGAEASQTANLLSVTKADGTAVLTVGNTTTDPVQIASQKVPMTEPVVFQVSTAAQSVNQTIFVADAAYQVTGVKMVWGTASSSGTATVEKLTGTTAPGSGTAMLQSTISTAGTANTVTAGTLTATTATLQLAAGDRIGFVQSGTQTGLVGLNVVVTLKRI